LPPNLQKQISNLGPIAFRYSSYSSIWPTLLLKASPRSLGSHLEALPTRSWNNSSFGVTSLKCKHTVNLF
jgi:hypothetical protein